MPQDPPSEQYPPDRIAFFHAPDKKRSPGGAISKVDNEAWLTKYTTANNGTAMMYLFVSDLGEYMKVRQELCVTPMLPLHEETSEPDNPPVQYSADLPSLFHYRKSKAPAAKRSPRSRLKATTV